MAGRGPATHDKRHVAPWDKSGDGDRRERVDLTVSHLDAGRRPLRFDWPTLPPVIGHRGAAAHAPENTLAGLRVAKQLGCNWVEFDVRLTADGAPVLCHDPSLER